VALFLAVAFLTTPAHAQVVRGQVTERVSDRPLAGVLVSVGGGALASGDTLYALTDTRGGYAIRLSRAGAYTLAFKRIGVARQLASVTVASGETRRVDVSLDAFASTLPMTAVTATNLCLERPAQLQRIVALWDEARTVLRASEVTLRDHSIHGWLSLYQRTLEPRSLRILSDVRSVAEGLYDRPMRSWSAEEIATFGFWGAIEADTLMFLGPDAEVLLADAFHRDYCFLSVDGRGERRGMLGIEFRPRRGLLTHGITGTMWLDMLSFELRFVEFRYAGLVTIPGNLSLGGEVHFAKHETGGWVVQRWHIRMPQFSRVQPAIASGHVSRRPPVVYRIVEQGGSLYAPTLQSWEAPATVIGTVLDSTGRNPVIGAAVSLSGTPYSTIVDSTGSFRFDNIIPGAYVLLASDPSYVAFGQLAADQPIRLSAGETYRARLTGATTQALRKALCELQPDDEKKAVLRVMAVDADSGSALARLRLWLRWPDPDQKPPADPTTQGLEQRLLGLQSETDATGSATFCGVPAGTRLDLMMLRDDDLSTSADAGRSVRITSFVLDPAALAARTVYVRRPK
jgi:hypothetical protein